MIKRLDSLQLPRESYSIQQGRDETLFLCQDGGQWFVFYGERGIQSYARIFYRLDSALREFEARLSPLAPRIGLK
ncbi:hypothetical protein [Pseudomonas sp. RIT-PI-AD]|uniref:hypothetical protein n=1 Tax=Pseudomonas sp. RIT-PI-AD TaxID=3035294 RepID=UPI0021D969E4|nr:hypothetical protein [Pseudomonas sp. RIT-PI-AD]